MGKTGNGKSSTANTILGLDRHFEVSHAFGSTTQKCQRHNNRRFGIPIEVRDECTHQAVTKQRSKLSGVACFAGGPVKVTIMGSSPGLDRGKGAF